MARRDACSEVIMNIVNLTPFQAEALPTRVLKDRCILTVVIKGTFVMHADQRAVLAEQPLPILFGDQYHDPDRGGSIRFEADIAPFKRRADIVLVGKAYAPPEQPATSVRVGLRVGALRKVLLVIGDRHWQVRGSGPPIISQPQPFHTMDLVYERAFGGKDDRTGEWCMENPVGCGFFSKKPRMDSAISLPNIENPEQLITDWQHRPGPSGFGLISKAWQPRMGYLGTYDELWQQERSPDPPRDFNPDFFNSAPLDQQVQGYLSGDESLDLVNLTPERRLRCQLPGIRPQVEITRTDRSETGQPRPGTTRVETLETRLDTLCLMPDDRQLTLIWRGHCSISDLTALEIDEIDIRMAG